MSSRLGPPLPLGGAGAAAQASEGGAGLPAEEAERDLAIEPLSPPPSFAEDWGTNVLSMTNEEQEKLILQMFDELGCFRCVLHSDPSIPLTASKQLSEDKTW